MSNFIPPAPPLHTSPDRGKDADAVVEWLKAKKDNAAPKGESHLWYYFTIERMEHPLMSLHATPCATERPWSFMRWIYRANRSSLCIDKARKMALVSFLRRAQAKDNVPFEPDMLLEFIEEELAAQEDPAEVLE